MLQLVLGAFAALAMLVSCKARETSSTVAEIGTAEDQGAVVAFLQSDQTLPVDAGRLATAPAVLQKASAGTALGADEGEMLLAAVRSTFKDCRFAGVETPLFAAVKAALAPAARAYYTERIAAFHETGFSRVAFQPATERWRTFAELVHEMDCLGLGLADVANDARSPKRRFYIRQAAEVASIRAYHQEIAWHPGTSDLPASDPDGRFLRPMTGAFEFIDFIDILVNMVPDAPMIYPRQNRPVWMLYDNSGVANLDGWREAQVMAATKVTPDLKDFYKVISRRFDQFTFRGGRVVGGGDLAPPSLCTDAGMVSWLGNTRFFRASRRQVAVLATNPLVATQWCDDGGQGPDDGVIAQYEYPSAHTYAFPVMTASAPVRRQPANYASLLSTELKNLLDQAKATGKLDRDDSVEAKQLTRAIIEELVQVLLQGWAGAADATNPASYPYQLLMSVHPSDDFNGRSLRAWYRHYESRRSQAVAATGVPLFLTDFNLDLYTSPEEFLEISLIAARQWGRMMAAFMRERSGRHKYYDVALPWAIAGDCENPIDPGKVVERVREWMRVDSHINLIRTKQKFDVDKGLRDALGALCP